MVIIGSIDEGGPAYGHLMAGDQIHMVNGDNVNGARHSHVNGLISNAWLLGEVELGIHRNLTGSEHTECKCQIFSQEFIFGFRKRMISCEQTIFSPRQIEKLKHSIW